MRNVHILMKITACK